MALGFLQFQLKVQLSYQLQLLDYAKHQSDLFANPSLCYNLTN